MNTMPRTLLMTRPAPARTRQRKYPPSPTAPRNITNEKSPKSVRPQAPSDIGEYALNTGVPAVGGEYRGDGRCQVAGNVVAAGKHRAFGARQAVGLGLVGEQEERVQAAVLLVAVEASLRHALCVKRVNALGGDLPHLIEWTE